jgi:hypothetical protein
MRQKFITPLCSTEQNLLIYAADRRESAAVADGADTGQKAQFTGFIPGGE